MKAHLLLVLVLNLICIKLSFGKETKKETLIRYNAGFAGGYKSVSGFHIGGVFNDKHNFTFQTIFLGCSKVGGVSIGLNYEYYFNHKFTKVFYVAGYSITFGNKIDSFKIANQSQLFEAKYSAQNILYSGLGYQFKIFDRTAFHFAFGLYTPLNKIRISEIKYENSNNNVPEEQKNIIIEKLTEKPGVFLNLGIRIFVPTFNQLPN